MLPWALLAVRVKVVSVLRFVAMAMSCPVTSLFTNDPPSRVRVSAFEVVQLRVELSPSATEEGEAVKFVMAGPPVMSAVRSAM